MISMTFPDVPTPPAVEVRIGRSLPPHVLDALAEQKTAGKNVVTMSRLLTAGEMSADARRAVKVRIAEDLRRQAAANKVLAAYNPGLIVRIGGGER
ncbi:hypothetical protein [Streptomyces sp. NPDC055243]|uniref:hypothetical protein n=1 Tax=Streptomyces sp. NPDC055243 TaxID=3365720 RepID=UPI0037D28D01